MARISKPALTLWQPTPTAEKTLHARVAVVIPVRNRLAATVRFLESFRQVSYPAYTLVVVDDGSTDGTGDVLREQFPEVVCLKGDGNLWWARSTNLGVRYALEQGYSHVLTINNDTLVSPDFLTHLVRTSLAHPGCIIGSRINFLSHPRVIWSVGGYMNWQEGIILQLRDHGGQEEEVLASRANPCPVEILTGCGTLVPAECYRRVGLYDAHSCPQYHADSEFILRAGKRGHAALVDLEAVIWNDVTSTCMSRNLFRRRSPWFWRAILAIHLRYCPRRFLFRSLRGYYSSPLFLAGVQQRLGFLWSLASRVCRPGFLKLRRASRPLATKRPRGAAECDLGAHRRVIPLPEGPLSPPGECSERRRPQDARTAARASREPLGRREHAAALARALDGYPAHHGLHPAGVARGR